MVVNQHYQIRTVHGNFKIWQGKREEKKPKILNSNLLPASIFARLLPKR